MTKWKQTMALVFGFSILLLVAAPAGMADDEWENEDDGTGTDTLLWHTAPAQRHDLQNAAGVADEDFFLIYPRAERSYEVQMLNVTGAAGIVGLSLDRLASDGTTVIQSETALDPGGFNYTLRWRQTSDADQFIRVTGTSSMGSNAQYDIQLFDTTLYCPRWNSSGTQITVLILQRAENDTSGGSCSYTIHWYDASSTLLTTSAGGLGQDDVDLFNTGSIGALSGQSGGAHISHTCGLGGIQAKAVALEPATGFSFDTPCTYLPR